MIRNLGIDRLRGALVILMVVGDYLAGIALVPSFMKHAPDVGFTLADTVAPAFVFVIGLNFGPSFARHWREGRAAAYRHFLLRYLALIGIGAVIAAGSTLAGQPALWGVLQALGVAGLICLLFIRLPAWARFLIGTTLLIGYQLLVDSAMVTAVLGSVHGGLLGAVSWGGLLVLSTAVADVWRKGLVPYILCVVALAAAGAVSAVIVPVSKNRVSISYILITLALSAIVFLAVDAISRLGRKRAGFLCWWGENALALYLLHLVILAAFVAPPVGWWYADAPVWLILAQLVVILGAMSVVAWWLFDRRHRLKRSLWSS